MTARVVRVVPDVATFAVDDGFSYLVPDALEPTIGSLVRVPLGGRVVRGWVIGEEDTDPDGLKAIRRVSGSMPVFGADHVRLSEWLGHHYVAPRAAVLRTFTPPNLPTRVPREEAPAGASGSRSHFVDGAEALSEVVEQQRGALVVAPTAVEVSELSARLDESAGGRVVALGPDAPAREVTKAWSRARLEDGIIVVATGRVAPWWTRDLAIGLVWDEQRRSHKDRQSPTFHPRTILSHRSRTEGFRLLTTGPVPSLEVRAAGTPVIGAGRRWGRVEVVDRTEEPPGSGVLSDRVKAALHGVVRTGHRAVVFTHRRGYAPSFRCTSCRALRTCPSCGTAATQAAVCRRCGSMLVACTECGGASFEPLGAAEGRVRDLLRRVVGDDVVGTAGDDLPITVAAEADLTSIASTDLVVVVDADGLLLGPHFRSQEAALALFGRLGRLVHSGAGSRVMVQTSVSDHPVIEALRVGDPSAFLDGESDRRAAAGYPPFGSLVVLEIRGEGVLAEEELKALEEAGAMVFGPLPARAGTRWLLQGRDLGAAKRTLRGPLQRLRDGGAAVRVDVDPLDV